MLGNCIMRNPSKMDGTLDKGALCESLLFFGKGHLLLDFGTMASVIHANFVDDLIAMLKAGYLTANYSPQAPVLYSDNKQGLSEHFFTVVKFGGMDPKKWPRNPELLEAQLMRLIEDKAQAKRYHRQLCDLISFRDLDDGSLATLARNDLTDSRFATHVARMALQARGIPDAAIKLSYLDILPLQENKFAISTDLNVDELRTFLPVGDRAAFGQNELFPSIGDARFDIHLAAQHNAAFVGNEKNQVLTNMILQRSVGATFNREAGPREIYDFISVATPSVREVINKGERSPQEFVKLMEKAEIFRTWLATQNPTADLVREMLREKAQVNWLETLPMKLLRFGLFTGLGKAGDFWVPGTSVVTEGIDTFLIERLAKRWRPHYFVENELRGFLDGKR
ncbi:MAG: hypothetical protein QOF14_5639 [Hyphomicrobiales bacterium]|nr:hypothetical protein [Hyphomicrobiales bacterium]